MSDGRCDNTVQRVCLLTSTKVLPWHLPCWVRILTFLAPPFLLTSSGPGDPLLLMPSSTSSIPELRSPPGLDCHQGGSVGSRISERQ